MTEFDLQQFDIKQNYAITASAGTGKTYSIVEIVNKLLTGGAYQLSDLLLVTFTEKAAGELKDRIREKLEAAGVDSAEVDSAVIGTIHSFCQKTIREFCVTAGKPSGLTLADEADCASYIEQFVRTGNIFREINALETLAEEDVGKLGKEVVKKLKAMIPKYYLNDRGEEDPEIVTLSPPSDPAAQPLYEEFKRFKPLASEDMEVVHTAVMDIFPEIEGCIQTLADSTAPKMQELADILQNDPCLSFDGRSYKKSSAKTDDEKRALESIADARDKIKKIRALDGFDHIEAAKKLANRYLPEVYLGWQAEKAKRCEQTYGDMIRTVREEVVNGRPLLDKLRGKYKYAIIDEFQDTNQLQWDIFKRVFLEAEDHYLTVVGDPKQSIYAFQGADVKVFDKAVGEIEAAGGTVCALSNNYRSTAKMVESTGLFFTGQIEGFAPSRCGRPEFKAYYEGAETEPYWIFGEKDANPTTYARSVCKMIIDCCSDDGNGGTKLRVVDKAENGFAERNVSFRDFALLARKRSEMEDFEKELKNCGIPFLRYKDNALFESRECAHWIAVLEAVDAPDFSGKNRGKLLKALYSMFFLDSIYEANDPQYKKDGITEIALFEKWRHAAADRRWEDLIDGILSESKVEKNLGGLNSLKSLGMIRQLGDSCLDYLSKGRSLTQLIKALKRKSSAGDTDEDGNEDSNLIAKSTDFDAVQVMTIHAAKGLQFPVVIFCGKFKGPPTPELYMYHGREGRVLSLWNDDVKDRIKQEADEELKRLIYVAFTRPQYILMLPSFYEKIDNGFVGTATEAYRGQHPHRAVDVEEYLSYSEMKTAVKAILGDPDVPDAEAADAQLESIRQLIGGKKARNTYKFSYSNLSHMHVPNVPVTAENGAQPDNSEDESTEEDTGLGKYDPKGTQILCRYDEAQGPIALSEKFPVGPKLGNALHTVFELADYRQAADTDDFAALAERCFKNEGFRVRPEWLEDVKEIARNVLAAELPSIRGSAECGAPFCLNELDFADRKNEAEFNFNKENEFLKRFFNGFIDLIFRRGETYSILDWKSDRLREDFTSYADAAELKKHVDELYAIQRVLYSYCLIKWLKNFYPALTEQEIFERHYGGIYYVFLRGCRAGTGNGVYAQSWACYGDLEAAYRNIVKERVEKNEELPESV